MGTIDGVAEPGVTTPRADAGTAVIRAYWPAVGRGRAGARRRRAIGVPPVVGGSVSADSPLLESPPIPTSTRITTWRHRVRRLAVAPLVVATVFIGSLALAQNAGFPLPSLAPSQTLDLQPLLTGRNVERSRDAAAGATGPARDTADDAGEPAIQPVSPVTEAADRARGDAESEAGDPRSRFDRIRQERAEKRESVLDDKKARLAAEARPFADPPFGLTAFEETVRNRPRPDFESYGLVLDDLWRGPLVAAGAIEDEPLADNPSGFEVFLGGAVERGWSSNILRTDGAEKSDGLTLAHSRLDLISDFDLWSLTGSFRSESARHDDEASEDYDDFVGRLGFATEYEDFLAISGEALYRQGHIARGSIDDPGAETAAGVRNPLVAFGETTLAGRFILGQADGFFIRPQVVHVVTDYDDVRTTEAVTGSPYDSSDFDRSETVFSTRIGKRLLRRQALFLEGRYTLTDYDNPVDRFGLNRDSTTSALTAGVEIEPTFVTALDLEAGYFRRSFDEASLDDVDGLFIRSRGLWNPTPVMTVTGTLDRSVQDALGGGGGSTIRTDGSLRLDWDPRENLILGIEGGYGQTEFQNQNRTDDLMALGVEVDYLLNEYLFLSARADHVVRDSTLAGYDFTETRAFLEIGVRLCCRSDNPQAVFLPRSYP